MALPASHVRFALDIAPELTIVDRGRFLAGTLYPDSRWVTGVPRRETHSRRYLQPDFPDSDYSLGIHVHCLCDRIQSRVTQHRFSTIDRLEGEERWIEASVLKMVQDMTDVQYIAMGDLLDQLGPAEGFNGEDPARVGDYYHLLRQTYGGRHQLLPEDYRDLWLKVGLDIRRTDRIMDRMAQVLAASDTLSVLASLHDESIAYYHRHHPPPPRSADTAAGLETLPVQGVK